MLTLYVLKFAAPAPAGHKVAIISLNRRGETIQVVLDLATSVVYGGKDTWLWSTGSIRSVSDPVLDLMERGWSIETRVEGVVRGAFVETGGAESVTTGLVVDDAPSEAYR